MAPTNKAGRALRARGKVAAASAAGARENARAATAADPKLKPPAPRTTPARTAAKAKVPGASKRRKMTAKERAAIADRMRRYWEERRKKG
jgi:hypothetical protein